MACVMVCEAEQDPCLSDITRVLGFTARADDPASRVGAELAEARGFEGDDFVQGLRSREVALPPKVSVSYRLIEHWLRGAGGLELDGIVPAQ